MSTKSQHAVARYVLPAIVLFGIPCILGFAARDFSDARVELDYGGAATLVETKWWGLSSRRHPLRLQNHAEWDKGLPYREPARLGECEWFVKDENGEWHPLDIFDPWSD